MIHIWSSIQAISWRSSLSIVQKFLGGCCESFKKSPGYSYPTSILRSCSYHRKLKCIVGAILMGPFWTNSIPSWCVVLHWRSCWLCGSILKRIDSFFPCLSPRVVLAQKIKLANGTLIKWIVHTSERVLMRSGELRLYRTLPNSAFTSDFNYRLRKAICVHYVPYGTRSIPVRKSRAIRARVLEKCIQISIAQQKKWPPSDSAAQRHGNTFPIHNHRGGSPSRVRVWYIEHGR